MGIETMEQLTLFLDKEEQLPVEYQPNFLTTQEADSLLQYCLALQWQQNKIKMRGATMLVPRQEYTAGDRGCTYRYSRSVVLEPTPWCPTLLNLRQRVEQATEFKFQIVIGNLYRTDSNSIDWHADQDSVMGSQPAIASISRGHQRKFQIRKKQKGSKIHDFWLTHGSLLLMRPGCQQAYKHQVPKTNKSVGVRVNLTFRPHLGGINGINARF